MSNLCKLMKEKLLYLQKLQNELLNKEYNLPLGTLKLSVLDGKYPRYYLRDANGKYEYIKRKDMLLVQQMAQKEYEQKVLNLLAKRISQLQKIVKDYSDTELEMLYENQHIFRKMLTTPVVESWEDKLNNWIQEEYEGKEFSPETPIIHTENGERVRSKSEKIIADYLCHKGINYKYEKPIKLRRLGIVHPDFTLLSQKINAEIYWEHFGRMDDPNYASMAVRKIDAYINSGILPGIRLIVTYETSNYPLQMQIVEKILANILYA